VRLRYENWANFGFGEANDDDFGLLRLRLHGDARLWKGLRLYAEGISAFVEERDLPGGKRLLDEDELDLLNAFGDLSAELGGAEMTLRVGRQEMQYGRQRLVSPLDWANTRRTFDGARLIAKSGGVRADAFYSRLVGVQRDEFNDGDSGQDLYGVYATGKVEPWVATADAYWLGLDKEVARFSSVTNSEERQTLGGRLAGACGDSGFDYDVEAAYQFGDFGDADVSAWMAAIEVGYKVPECPVESRLYAGYDYASGDDDRGDGDIGTFNQLYPLGHAYFGMIDAVGRQNVQDFTAGIEAKPLAKLKTRLEAHYFLKAEEEDALYDAGGNPVAAANVPGEDEIGQEVDLTAEYAFDAHMKLAGGVGRLFAGDAIADSGDDIDFLYMSAQYTF
jgi:hypothetical protein